MVEVEVGDDTHVPIIEFRMFQSREARNESSTANVHIRRLDTVAEMVVAHHLGRRLVAMVVVVRFVGKDERVGKWHRAIKVHPPDLVYLLAEFA